jgi:VanZ family protein
VSDAPAALRWHLRWLTAGWVMVVAVVLLSLTRLPFRVDIADVDKLEHAFAYLVLMAWFGGLSPRAAHRWIALGLLVLGGLIEVAQGLSGYRTADARDLLADAVGIALGWALARSWAPAWFARVERLLGR